MEQYTPNNDFATKILFDVVSGEKVLNFEELESDSFPNIGAFRINESTYENISDVILSLLITWKYFPDKHDLNRLYSHIKDNYTSIEAMLFNLVIKTQMKTALKQSKYKEIFVYDNSFSGWIYSKSHFTPVKYIKSFLRDGSEKTIIKLISKVKKYLK